MPDADHRATQAAIVSGETWVRFCDTLGRAGQQILRPEAPVDALTRAEGWRYLTRLARIALEMHVEYGDPLYPGFVRPSHETAKIGADNPDNLYLSARLDGRHDYLVRGRRGSVHGLYFATKSGGYADADGRMPGSGFLDGRDLQVAADGTFELRLSTQRRAGNWLAMTVETNQLLVRQTFLDRAREQAAELEIECLGAGPRPPLDPIALHDRLQRAAAFVENTARLFADWVQLFRTQPVNTLPARDQQMFQAAGGDPNIFYFHGHWALDEDEALLVEVAQLPPCDFWNFQLDNYWMESLDYRHHRIHHNQHSARRDAAGGVRLIVAHRDPGLPNWLETAGHRAGTMCFRWIGASQTPAPQTRVVKLSELASLAAVRGAGDGL